MGVGRVEGSQPPPHQPVEERLTDQGGAVGSQGIELGQETLVQRHADGAIRYPLDLCDLGDTRSVIGTAEATSALNTVGTGHS